MEVSISLVFDESVTVRQLDGRTNERTNGRTDRFSYRDSRTHLKTAKPNRPDVTEKLDDNDETAHADRIDKLDIKNSTQETNRERNTKWKGENK